MKEGIIIYSHTGNTLKAAEALRDALVRKGHEASILRVHAQNESPGYSGPVVLTETPDPALFDALFFGAPVYAFSLCPIMKAYLQGIGSLSGKKASLFVTHRFPFAFLGGNRAVRQMAALCRDKGAIVAQTAVVNWDGKELEKQIGDAAGMLAGA